MLLNGQWVICETNKMQIYGNSYNRPHLHENRTNYLQQITREGNDIILVFTTIKRVSRQESPLVVTVKLSGNYK